MLTLDLQIAGMNDSTPLTRDVQTLQMEIQQIMKGKHQCEDFLR